MDEVLQEKVAGLRRIVSSMESVAVAFSGGVDSTLLLKIAHDMIGDRAKAVIGLSASFPEREARAAQDFCIANSIPFATVDSGEMRLAAYVDNPPNRCYICKKALFGQILQYAKENAFAEVAEGSNLDDDGDYRPGREAIAELGVRSPLHEAGFTKADVREAARELGLAVWNKPAFACLASRFPYGEKLTKARFERVDRSENAIRALDQAFALVRVRSHGDTARIEVPPAAIAAAAERRREISAALHEAGFAYVSLDLDGYRTGSMNEVL